MDKKEFKMLFNEIASNNGYIYKEKNLYKETDTLIIIIDFQKSNYSNGYYINYGILIKEINKNLVNFRNIQYDFSGRMIDNKKIENKDLFELDVLEKNSYLESINSFFKNIIKEIETNGIQRMFEIYPGSQNVLTLKAKKIFKQ